MEKKLGGILSCDRFSGISGNMGILLDMVRNGNPEAYALVYGKSQADCICGNILFYPLWGGTLVVAEVSGLPENEERCSGKFFGFHIHEGKECRGTPEEPFAAAGGHFSPQKCSHPFHAGDMLPLMGNHGYALSMFFTDRFTPEEVIGRTVVIHDMPDDFKTDPSGASGTKIACGEIKEYHK